MTTKQKFRSGSRTKLIQTLNFAECATLLDQLQNDRGTHVQKVKGTRNYCMALLMLDAGLRVGEVTQLQVADLWIQNEPVTSIIVRAEIAKRHQKRKIPVSERLSSAIKLLAKYYWARYHLSGNHFAFASTNKNYAPSARQIERIIKDAGRRAFNRDIHPHVLRHTFATRLMGRTSIRVVQELLGHKSLTSTQIYTHPNDQDLKNAIESIGNGKEAKI
ncbi:MAG: tyrosine-type recombinase/integrase [Desulfobacterales bacterium]|nr:tyrosine-type recombinase/integrase [Desulfobacterales bacterium]